MSAYHCLHARISTPQRTGWWFHAHGPALEGECDYEGRALLLERPYLELVTLPFGVLPIEGVRRGHDGYDIGGGA